MVVVLLAALVAIGVAYLIMLVRIAQERGGLGINWEAVGLGAVTDFFDTLGIGSYAPSTAWIKFRRLVPDSFIPGVLTTGHALPTIAQALIFITLVEVDPFLLFGCIVAAVAGGMLGAPVVQQMAVKRLQLIVGFALLIAARCSLPRIWGFCPQAATRFRFRWG